MANGLKGLRVLVTRPAHQAESLCAAIDAAGGHALRQPLLAIQGLNNTVKVATQLAQCEDAFALIFTSANAVDWAWKILPEWRPQNRIFAVGKATAEALRKHVGDCVREPEADYSSEGLLALPELDQIDAQRIALITGENGRKKLAQTLSARGARVSVVPVYRRKSLSVPRARLVALLNEVDVAFVSSTQSLEHLHSLTPAALRDRLYQLQLVVPSARVVKRALELGFTREPIYPIRMQEASIVASLQQCAQRGARARH